MKWDASTRSSDSETEGGFRIGQRVLRDIVESEQGSVDRVVVIAEHVQSLVTHDAKRLRLHQGVDVGGENRID